MRRLLNVRRNSIPTKTSVFCHSTMMIPASCFPSKLISPRHVNLVCVLPSANVIGVVPRNSKPIGKASRMGMRRKPLKPVSTIAVRGTL
jgi:hypothetical protein